MKWEDYLVSYPSLEDESFSQEIVRHEELYPESYECEEGNFCHQERIARYMSYFTFYDSLLVIHEMGTGKTGVAIALMDTLKQQQNVPRILFLCNNATIEHNFYTEVKKYSVFFRQQWKDMSKDLPEDKKSSRWNAVFTTHGLLSRTYQKFYNELKEMSDANILHQFKDCLIICDEAHHLHFKTHKEETLSEKRLGEKIYEQIYRFFDVLGMNKKALVMTGTPIRDQPEEIILLFNLVLASKKVKLPPPHEFLEEYFVKTKEIKVPILSLSSDMNSMNNMENMEGEEEKVDENNSVRSIMMPVYQWAPEAERRLFQLLKGRISFLRQKLSNVEIEYVGKVFPPMQHLRLRPNFMDDIQLQTYITTIPGFSEEVEDELGGEEGGEEEEEMATSGMAGALYSATFQASLFVYPWYQGEDQEVKGLIGKEGFTKFIDFKISTGGLRGNAPMTFRWKDENSSSSTKAWPPDVWTALVSPDTSRLEKIEILRRFSTIYADVLDCFFSNVRQLCYVYSDLVRGSGIMVLALILKKFFGFTMITRASQIHSKKERTPGFRFIFVNDLFHIRDSEVQELLSYMNHPDNATGEYCQILLSTNKTKEGISVLNIQQIHILTPSWNFADISQAIARGLRTNSHRRLVELGVDNVKVRIFLHAALIPFPEEQQGQTVNDEESLFTSIDYQRYLRSEVKDFNTRVMYRFLSKAAWDCPWTKTSNVIEDASLDGTRNCDYQECQYTCYGEDKLPLISQRLDVNWLTFYGEKDRRLVLGGIMQHLQETNGHSSFEETIHYLQSRFSFPIVQRLLMEVLEDACRLRIPFVSSEGKIKYLHFLKHQMELVDHPFLSIGFNFPKSFYSLLDTNVPRSSCRLDWSFPFFEKFYQQQEEERRKWVTHVRFLMENIMKEDGMENENEFSSLESLFGMWGGEDNPQPFVLIIKTLVEMTERSNSVMQDEIGVKMLTIFHELAPSLLSWKPTTATTWDDIQTITLTEGKENVVYSREGERPYEWKKKRKSTRPRVITGGGVEESKEPAPTEEEQEEEKEESVPLRPVPKKVELEPGTPDFERLITNNNDIGFYAIIKGPSFLIRDVRNKELFENVTNRRHIPSGLQCGSFKFQCTLYLLFLFLKIDDELRNEIRGILETKYSKRPAILEPTPENIESMRQHAWFPKLTSTAVSPALMTEEDVENNIQDIYMLSLLKRDANMCPLLRKLFIKHNLNL
jgi:hypothetical protein